MYKATLLKDIKNLWISFFKDNGYFELEELDVLPKEDDNSILWINSGVSALKKYFVNPDISPSKNMVNSQRVIRTNDIDRIDKNSYHQTFFEMLGCFSIGGNFKSDVIPLIWSFFTEENRLNISPANLFVTVLENDYETFSIWEKQPGLLKERIFFCSKESNFWDMGEGPCGPNTEIYYCFDPEKLKNETVNFDDKNFLEIANLVFSDRYHKGKDYFPLEKKCVDVGVGLERVALVVQGVSNTFQIDVWKTPLAFLKEIYSKSLNDTEPLGQNDWKFNVIVDHLRTFIIVVFDGVLPDSKHRGYIVRKLIKRSFWISFSLGFSIKDLLDLSSVIIDSNNHIPGIFDKKQYIIKVVEQELTKLSESLRIYQREIDNYLNKNLLMKDISSDVVFFWYDTKGIPIDLIYSSLKKRNIRFDEKKFEDLLNKQKSLGISDRKSKKNSVF